MSGSYDGVILGAGHNSLVLQAYLGRAGFKTICLERREKPGGGLETIEHPAGSGRLHNTHSFFHRALNQLPWYQDLELQRFGAEYLEPEYNVALIDQHHEVLGWWTDFEKTCASFARFSEHDAQVLRRYRDEFRPIVQQILLPESRRPPLPPEQRQQELAATPAGRRLLEVSRLSPLEFVLQEFEHPTIQAGLLFFNGLREVDLRLPGFGHHIPALLASDGMAQMCVGGAERLSDALVRAVEESGGEVRCGARPRRILVEAGRAVGVETHDGDVVHAKQFVVSGLNPQQTFLELIDDQHLPSEWRDKATAFQYNLLAPLFALNLSLREPPRYTAAESDPTVEQAFMVILGLNHVDQFQEIIRCHEAGKIPPPVMWGACPTQFDPTHAPQGGHTAFMWEKLPHRLQGDPQHWNAAARQHGRDMLELWRRFAPNLNDAVEDSFVRSPLETEQTFWNMREGDLLVGAFAGGQVGYNRPFAGAGHYRGHIESLYLCGSCCHPGGNITGLPGYNAAQVMLADAGVAHPFMP